MNKWTIEEESKMLKMIQNKNKIKDISLLFNRSENAIELRLKKIIYENINNGKSIEFISKILNLSKDKIKKYYNSYVDRIKKDNKYKKRLNNLKIKDLDKEINNNKDINNNKEINNKDINNKDINNNKEIEYIKNENLKLKLLLKNYILKIKIMRDKIKKYKKIIDKYNIK
jgi:hypothetical protein